MSRKAAASGVIPSALGGVGRFVRHMLEGPVGEVTRFASLDHNVLGVLHRRAVAELAEYIAARMPDAVGVSSRELLWALACREAPAGGLWLELGVFQGYSLNFLADRAPGTVYGFDSFEGLKEDWKGTGLLRGTFDLRGRLPKVRRNAELVRGWFDASVPPFLAQHPEPLALLHLDCDTYEATVIALDLLKARLTPGTVIVFDDYHGFWGFREGQFKAWAEFVARERLAYRYLAFNRHAVAVSGIAAIVAVSQ